MNPFLRGLRMAGDAGIGRSVVRYVFIGVVDFICLLMAAESLNAIQYKRAGAWLVAGLVSLLVGSYWPRIRRRFGKKLDIDIVWKPGEQTYHYPYENVPGIQYRVCIVNNTDRNLDNVRVTLERLTPHVLNAVPCPLKLMHDNKPPYPTSFSLARHGKRFVDLIVQWPSGAEFWILHTVVDAVGWVVPAQGYYMTIRVESDDADPVSRDFELVKNGQLWDLKDRGISRPPRESGGRREVSSGPDVVEPRRKTASAATEKQAAPTLLSLMDTSFPSLNKLWGKPVFHFEDGSSLEVRSALYFDLFTYGAKFLGFYVPTTPRVLEVCALLAAHATELGDALAKGGLSITAKAPGENPQTVSDLTYSGKVYLHHEDILTHRQMAEVEEMFKAHKLSVVLRGPDYLSSAWLEWKRKGN